MSLSPTSPVVGLAMAGLTSPTYTLTLDTTLANVKQYAVTSIGGTQTGVTAHSPSSPFFVSLTRPASFKQVGTIDPVTGQLRSVPRNTWKLLFGKGMIPFTNQAPTTGLIRAEIVLPAGCETADINSLAALFSFAGGFIESEMGDVFACVKNGLL